MFTGESAKQAYSVHCLFVVGQITEFTVYSVFDIFNFGIPPIVTQRREGVMLWTLLLNGIL